VARVCPGWVKAHRAALWLVSVPDVPMDTEMTGSTRSVMVLTGWLGAVKGRQDLIDCPVLKKKLMIGCAAPMSSAASPDTRTAFRPT
jgi:hypothetical protein